MLDLFGGAGARRHYCKAAMSLHLSQRVRATPSNVLRIIDVTQLHDYSVNTNTNMNEIQEQANKNYKFSNSKIPYVSSRCIDEWFEVNRSCPEHPSD